MRADWTFRHLLTAVLTARRTLLIAGWMATGGWIAVGQEKPTSDAGKDFTISADVQLVVLDVSVRDKDGGFVSGLERNQFKVYENGKLQTISQFSNKEQPVTVGLVIDNSGSMRPKRPEVVTAALIFIGASNPLDEMFVINFNDTVRHGLPDTVLFSDDIQQLRSALWKGDATGRTALYDAVLAGLKQLDMGRQSKKTLIVVSDGGDNISKAGFKEVMSQVLESRATIYTIGIFDENDPDRNPGVLRRLAEVSGGVAYFPAKLSEVTDICRQIAKDIRSRYTVAYVPQDVGHPGIKHIKVEVGPSERGKLIAHTRTSYVIGQQTASADRKP